MEIISLLAGRNFRKVVRRILLFELLWRPALFVSSCYVFIPSQMFGTKFQQELLLYVLLACKELLIQLDPLSKTLTRSCLCRQSFEAFFLLNFTLFSKNPV